VPLDDDLRRSHAADAYCWRTRDDLPPPDEPPLRAALAAAELERELAEDEYDHAPEWRRAEMNQTLCPCAAAADCGDCGAHGACLGERCACLHTERARFVGARCERVDECDGACENDGECLAEQCRCRALTFGDRCEQRCASVFNLTLCEAFNGVPFQRPHLLFRAEARVASALTLKCRDVAHALCADAVLVAKPCEREPLRIAFLLVVPDSDADRAALLGRARAPVRAGASVCRAAQRRQRGAQRRAAHGDPEARRARGEARADARLLRDETPQSRARGDAVYRANPLLFVQPTTRWVDGGFSMVQVVHDAAKQLFAHDANAYDFLVPLNVRAQANVAPIAQWEAIARYEARLLGARRRRARRAPHARALLWRHLLRARRRAARAQRDAADTARRRRDAVRRRGAALSARRRPLDVVSPRAALRTRAPTRRRGGVDGAASTRCSSSHATRSTPTFTPRCSAVA
jgi:hypothetical protein